MIEKPFKILTYIFSIVMAALIVINMNFVMFANLSFEQVISNSLLSLTAIFAIAYALVGCTKEKGAKYYHLFMISYSITMLLLIFLNRARAPFSIFFNLIIYGCLCVLSAAQDLGKSKSIILASTVLALSVVTLFFNFNNSTQTFYATFCRILRLFISATTLLMVLAKYRDKDIRNTI